jgi:hypothetical protein
MRSKSLELGEVAQPKRSKYPSGELLLSLEFQARLCPLEVFSECGGEGLW